MQGKCHFQIIRESVKKHTLLSHISFKRHLLLIVLKITQPFKPTYMAKKLNLKISKYMYIPIIIVQTKNIAISNYAPNFK